MAPFTDQLLINLLKALTLPGSAENEYIMKGERLFLLLCLRFWFWFELCSLPLFPPSAAIMRSFSLLQDSIVPYIPTLIGQLTHKLLSVSKVKRTWPVLCRGLSSRSGML